MLIVAAPGNGGKALDGYFGAEQGEEALARAQAGTRESAATVGSRRSACWSSVRVPWPLALRARPASGALISS